MIVKNFDAGSLALQVFLKKAADEVLPTLPRPYGSLPKAKYTLEVNGERTYRVPLYTLVTTVHEEEFCVEYLKRFFLSQAISGRTINIIKYSEGEEKLLFSGGIGKQERTQYLQGRQLNSGDITPRDINYHKHGKSL